MFLLSDELGSIKSISYAPHFAESSKASENKPENEPPKILLDGPSSGKTIPIQKLAANKGLITAAYKDGSTSVFRINEDDESPLQSVLEWKETRMKAESKFVGLSIHESEIFSCTSNGALRLSKIIPPSSDTETSYTLSETHVSSLPMRLNNWRLSPSGRDTFAYAGHEVELSLWDVDRAFSQPPPTSESINANAKGKRKRNETLLPGEIWRARNVPNDNLGLRQPVNITSLSYIHPKNSQNQGGAAHIAVGTALGDVRRYDTRAARRPVAVWNNVGKIGGVKLVETGFAEHELFVADNGCNLFALDLRNGRVTYSYKGISGAINSIAPSPSVMLSTSLDRLVRIHSTFPPPPVAGSNLDQKGSVLERIYVQGMPTAIVWDGTDATVTQGTDAADEEDENSDKLWEQLENVGDDDAESDAQEKRKKKKK